MGMKQTTPFVRKDGAITRIDRNYANQQVETMLKEHKARTGDVVLITINSRTTIELPACLTLEEREARVENYRRLHKSKV